jgi:hypothetical protein
MAITGLVLILTNRNKSGQPKTLSEDQISGKETEPEKVSGDDIIGSKDKLKSSDFPLEIGSRGYYVLMTQARINYLFGLGLKMDGVLGNETRQAIINKPPYLTLKLTELRPISFTREMYDGYATKIKAKTGGLKAYYQYLVKNEKTLNGVLTLYGLKLSPDIYKAANS